MSDDDRSRPDAEHSLADETRTTAPGTLSDAPPQRDRNFFVAACIVIAALLLLTSCGLFMTPLLRSLIGG